MDRIQTVKDIVEETLSALEPEARREAHIHLYGVAQAAALLAMKRGQDAELCTICGLLHDLHTYRTGDSAWHAHHGAFLAQGLLEATGLFTAEEVGRVAAAIYFHSDKGVPHDPFSQVLVDADVLQHTLYDPAQEPFPSGAARFNALREEFGLGV